MTALLLVWPLAVSGRGGQATRAASTAAAGLRADFNGDGAADLAIGAPGESLAAVKGAQRRSCSLSVLVKETAEQVASVHSALVILAQDGQLGRRMWRLQQQRPVGRWPLSCRT